MQIFRPNHKGCLTLVDFCKSVDSLYKELRLLRASVRNSQKIDQSFERIFNVVFYTILICVCLALLGFDPLALFLSLSSFALAFSFMISRASSNYFDVSTPSCLEYRCILEILITVSFVPQGLLFILCRRPYDIGDRIVVQGVETQTSWNGTTDCAFSLGIVVLYWFPLLTSHTLTRVCNLFMCDFIGIVKDIDLFKTTIVYGMYDYRD